MSCTRPDPLPVSHCVGFALVAVARLERDELARAAAVRAIADSLRGWSAADEEVSATLAACEQQVASCADAASTQREALIRMRLLRESMGREALHAVAAAVAAVCAHASAGADDLRAFADLLAASLHPHDGLAPAIAESAVDPRAAWRDVAFSAQQFALAEAAEAPAAQIRVVVERREVVSYAMCCAGAPIVGAVVVHNESGATLPPAVVRIRVSCAVATEPIADRQWQIAALAPGAEARLERPELALDARVLVQLDEPAQGLVEVIVSRDGETLQRAAAPLRFLAYSQWARMEGMEELLACHVLPNHPAVEQIRDVASDALRSRTGHAAQQGYQSGPQRAAEILEALYVSLQQAAIRYSEPPASEGQGQKIRTPDQVTEQRFGTCLDLACLYAACAEQAGLRPLLFVVDGHVFVGAWLQEDVATPPATVRDFDVVMSWVEAGALVAIEVVGVCEGQQLTFADAIARGRSGLVRSRFLFCVDIRSARQEGVRPLPSRARDGDSVVVVQQGASAAETVVMGQRRVQPRVESAPAPRRVVEWQNRLLDLTLRNPLLNLRLGKTGGVRLVLPPESVADVERALCSEQPLLLVAHDELTQLQRERGARFAADIGADLLRRMFVDDKALFCEVESQRLRGRLRQLASRARTMEEETGSSVLHITLASVTWTDPEKGRAVRSPLFVLPVRLRMQARGKPPLLIADLSRGGTTVNHCLLQKFAQTFRFDAGEVASWRGDLPDADLRQGLQAMRMALAQQGLPFSVEEDASLSLLHFGTFRMWRDLQEHWQTFVQRPVVRHLVERPGQAFEDDVALPTREDLETSRVHCPIPVDGSQLEAVLAAARGCSFVLEGPPGTGKSQTIANLVANALADGKKVLFVAEKRAALDVVKRRLHKVGLSAYCLDIHGRAQKPQELREQLMRSLDAQFTADLDAFARRREALDARRAELRRYAEAVHEVGALGLSLWSARQRALELGDGPSFPLSEEALAALPSRIAVVREAAARLPSAAVAAELRPRHPYGFCVATSFERVDVDAVVRAIAELQSLHERVGARVDAACSLDALLAIATGLEAAALGVTLEHRAVEAGASNGGELGSIATALASLQRDVSAMEARCGDAWRSSDLDAAILAIETAQRSFFLFRGGRIRKAVAAATSTWPAAPADAAAALAALRAACDAKASAIALESRVRRVPGWSFADGWSLLHAEGRRAIECALAAIRHAVAGAESERGTDGATTVCDAWRAPAADREAIRALANARVRALRALLAAVASGEGSLLRWLDGRTLAAACRESLATWTRDAAGGRLLGLVRWTRLSAALEPFFDTGLAGIADGVVGGAIEAAAAGACVERSIAHACLDERMKALGFFRFDGKEHGERVREHAEWSDADCAALSAALPVMLLATRPFRPGQRIGRVGDLVRSELMRQKGGRSIRALLEDYADAVLALTPCVFASPDSVAQFLAPGVIDFDLVVFDEASQIPVADAIGAMGRGKSVVVVGDSRQMPPTTFFLRGNGSGETDEGVIEEPIAEEATEDMESILSESVASGLRRLWLSWHYRSQDESLIAFSNQRYYEGRLASFPSPRAGNGDKGVAWIKVDGATFDSGASRTNEMEAAAVVAEVRRRLRDPAAKGRSFGVVAMNLQQAELLRERFELEAENDPELQRVLDEDVDERMFVKNLENVQGDERDVIVISLTYAKAKDGTFAMNFGPLGKVGGERRWNVLVTRARQQVVVVSSMEPDEIRVERVSALAKGVHDMRAYVAMCKERTVGDLSAALPVVGERDLHRDAIAAALRARGLVVETDLGLSSFRVDLALAHAEDPTRRLVAVLLDGRAYRERRTVQDREALPAAVLRHAMGWPEVRRVWLPEWIVESERVVEELCAAVDAARAVVSGSGREVVGGGAVDGDVAQSQTDHVPGSGPSSSAVAPSRVDAAADAASQTRKDAAGPAVSPTVRASASVPVHRGVGASAVPGRDPEDCDYVPYVDFRLAGRKEDLDALPAAFARERVRAACEAVLAVEAPIEAMRLAKLVARRFGLQRVRDDRALAVLSCIDRHLIDESPFGAFVWASLEQRDAWRAFRRTPLHLDPPRPFDEIAPQEVRNALVYCARKGMGVSMEGAVEEIAAVFGVRRVTAEVRERVGRVVEWAVGLGALQRDADGVLRV